MAQNTTEYIDRKTKDIIDNIESYALKYTKPFLLKFLKLSEYSFKDRLKKRGLNYSQIRRKLIIKYIEENINKKTIAEIADYVDLSYHQTLRYVKDLGYTTKWGGDRRSGKLFIYTKSASNSLSKES